MAFGTKEKKPVQAPGQSVDRPLFNMIRDGILYLDGEGRVVDANPAFTTITGIARDSIMGRQAPEAARELFSLEDLPRVLTLIGRVLKGEDIPQSEVNFRDRRLTVESRRSAADDGVRVLLIRDISDRDFHETILRNLSHDLAWLNDCSRRLLELETPEKIHVFMADELYDRFHPILAATSEIDEEKEILITRGYRADESLTSRAMELVGGPPVGQAFPIRNNAIKDEMRQGKLHEFEGGLSKITLGRIPRPAALVVEKLLGMDRFLGQGLLSQGRLIGAIALAFRKGQEFNLQILEAFIDLCGLALRRSRVEERLRDSEARLMAVAESTTDSIYSIDLDADGRPLLTHETKSLSGFPLSEIAAPDQWSRIFMPDDLKEFKGRIDKVVRTRMPGELVCRIRTREGGVRWVHLFFRPRFDPDGKRVIGLLAGAKDITRERSREAENRRLEDQVQQVRMLESLGMLAGGLAHDFNNLFMGLFGFLEVALHRSAAQPDITDPLEKAVRVIDKAKALTGKLLTLSKGGAPLGRTQALEPLLRAKVESALAGSDVALIWKMSPVLPELFLDEDQLGQAIGHVVENARQAMGDRGALTVSADRFECDGAEPPGLAPGSYVRIGFHDSGPGISEEDLALIFNPFFTTRTGRSGLGLTLAYSIAARHGGLLTAASPPGSGAVVTFHLPASKSGTPL